MNRRTEKTITVVVGKSGRCEMTVGPDTCLADLRSALGLPDFYSFSLTRKGHAIPEDASVLQRVTHKGRLYAQNGQRVEQLTLRLDSQDELGSGAGSSIGPVDRPPDQKEIHP